MHAPSSAQRFAKPRTGELVFFLAGAGIFAFALSMLGIVCVVCAHPATVGFG